MWLSKAEVRGGRGERVEREIRARLGGLLQAVQGSLVFWCGSTRLHSHQQ